MNFSCLAPIMVVTVVFHRDHQAAIGAKENQIWNHGRQALIAA